MITTDYDYRPNQCEHHFALYLNFIPEWFIDLGPASGSEYIDMIRQWPHIKVIALEPSIVGYQSALKRFPKDKQHRLLNVAAWECDGKVRLYHPNDLLHSRLYKAGQEAYDDNPLPVDVELEDSIVVDCRSVDSLSDQYGPFNNAALWLDVEGSERRALKGAAKLFARRAIRAVNIESRPEYSDEIAKIMTDAGLTLVWRYNECSTVRDEVWVMDGTPDYRLEGHPEWGRPKV